MDDLRAHAGPIELALPLPGLYNVFNALAVIAAGLRSGVAAETIRGSYPEVGVLVLSQYVDSGYALRLLEQHPEAVGYLLKERVSDIAVLADAIHRIAEGECVLDPTIVARLVNRPRHRHGVALRAWGGDRVASPRARLHRRGADRRQAAAGVSEGGDRD